uniref:RAB7A interacting MON1-CCZ1 complex subunit 1 n=2 Tax=Elapinae TaxID=42168 RepID=A0A8C6X6Z9_NAJNA
EEFPEESSLQKVEELIGALSSQKTWSMKVPLEILGIELLECLYWRRGALIYMFCHTVKGRKEWLRKETDLLKKFLKEGIHYLIKMLDFRCTDNPNEEFVVQDTGTAILVNEGIFSDTHLLAMMYCGEMCYWGLKYCGDQGTELHRELPGSSENIIMDFQEIGEKMLTKYIAVCEGPLRSHGWDTKNAKRILDYFKQLSS